MNIVINKDVQFYYYFGFQNSLLFTIVSLFTYIDHQYKFNQTIVIKYLALFVILMLVHTLLAFIKSITPWPVEILIENEKRELLLKYSKKNNINMNKIINFDDVKNVIFSFDLNTLQCSKLVVITANIFFKNDNIIKLEFQDLESFLQTYTQLNQYIPTEIKSNKKNNKTNLDEIIRNYTENKTIPKKYEVMQKNNLLTIIISFTIFLIFFLCF